MKSIKKRILAIGTASMLIFSGIKSTTSGSTLSTSYTKFYLEI